MINIALICDDAYVLPTMVVIQSIATSFESNEKMVDIHVCSPSLQTINIEKLKSLEKERLKINVHIIGDAIFKNFPIASKTHVSKAALIKFELPNLFSDIDYMLYLDSDIIVKKDFFKIFDIDIKDYYLAASFELWKYLERLRFRPSELKQNPFYFNSGVMFFNLKKMREDSISKKLWDYKLNHSKTKLMDQESFNAVCKSKVRPLSIKWNFNPFFFTHNYLPLINKIYSENYENVDELIEDVKIIHYVGKADKPWIYKKAQLRCFWDDNYKEINIGTQLSLKDYSSKKESLIGRMVRIKSTYGIIGLLNFIKYRIIGRTK